MQFEKSHAILGLLVLIGLTGLFANSANLNLTSAVVAGSCVNSCGSKSPDGCWCDTSCIQYGDCCVDYKPSCTTTGPICPPEPVIANPPDGCSYNKKYDPNGCFVSADLVCPPTPGCNNVCEPNDACAADCQTFSSIKPKCMVHSFSESAYSNGYNLCAQQTKNNCFVGQMTLTVTANSQPSVEFPQLLGVYPRFFDCNQDFKSIFDKSIQNVYTSQQFQVICCE